ncbi:MAG: hypothetical protein ACU83N_03110 [Gammaproteobacteria bacterium]
MLSIERLTRVIAYVGSSASSVIRIRHIKGMGALIANFLITDGRYRSAGTLFASLFTMKEYRALKIIRCKPLSENTGESSDGTAKAGLNSDLLGLVAPIDRTQALGAFLFRAAQRDEHD